MSAFRAVRTDRWSPGLALMEALWKPLMRARLAPATAPAASGTSVWCFGHRARPRAYDREGDVLVPATRSHRVASTPRRETGLDDPSAGEEYPRGADAGCARRLASRRRPSTLMTGRTSPSTSPSDKRSAAPVPDCRRSGSTLRFLGGFATLRRRLTNSAETTAPSPNQKPAQHHWR